MAFAKYENRNNHFLLTKFFSAKLVLLFDLKRKIEKEADKSACMLSKLGTGYSDIGNFQKLMYT